ncbi:hypothetical protein JXA47_12750 [Candidatus Sumerlaeota bacterium]|nr:hypothetical protein [Candidatus Sumerlaeota bacterium]
MLRTLLTLTLVIAAVGPLTAQELVEIDGHPALIFGQIGRPPREALGYRDGVFVTPATLERLGAESNSVVEMRYPGAVIEARIFPILGESRRDTTLYMASAMRERLGVDSGAHRVEILALGMEGNQLGPPETDLPPCGEEGAWVFQRVGRPPSESLELGRAVLVRSDKLEAMGLAPGTPVTVTVDESSIEVEIHPLDDPERYETSVYLRGSLREELGIEDGPHQVVVHSASEEAEL